MNKAGDDIKGASKREEKEGEIRHGWREKGRIIRKRKLGEWEDSQVSSQDLKTNVVGY